MLLGLQLLPHAASILSCCRNSSFLRERCLSSETGRVWVASSSIVPFLGHLELVMLAEVAVGTLSLRLPVAGLFVIRSSSFVLLMQKPGSLLSSSASMIMGAVVSCRGDLSSFKEQRCGNRYYFARSGISFTRSRSEDRRRLGRRIKSLSATIQRQDPIGASSHIPRASAVGEVAKPDTHRTREVRQTF